MCALHQLFLCQPNRERILAEALKIECQWTFNIRAGPEQWAPVQRGRNRMFRMPSELDLGFERALPDRRATSGIAKAVTVETRAAVMFWRGQ